MLIMLSWCTGRSALFSHATYPDYTIVWYSCNFTFNFSFLRFRIGETDGIIRTNVVSKLLDRETIDVYYLTITATDGKVFS